MTMQTDAANQDAPVTPVASQGASPRLSRGSPLQWFDKKPRLVRWLIAGPGALIATILLMGGMAFWWPRGAAGIDQIAMPIVLFPLIWVGVFLYAVLDDSLGRAALVLTGLSLGNGVLIAVG